MPTTAMKDDYMNNKIISVSKKRQITIPLEFYKQLDFGKEVECYLEDGKLIIKPLRRDNSEFSIEILKDLVSQGYSGDELVERFESQSQDIKKAITNLREEADTIAAGEKPAATLNDVFASEE